MQESEEYQQQEDGVFPDNERIVNCFVDMITQWRAGPSGAIGLDYNVLPFIFRTRQIKRKHHEEILDGLQIMERAALKTMVNNGTLESGSNI